MPPTDVGADEGGAELLELLLEEDELLDELLLEDELGELLPPAEPTAVEPPPE